MHFAMTIRQSLFEIRERRTFRNPSDEHMFVAVGNTHLRGAFFKTENRFFLMFSG